MSADILNDYLQSLRPYGVLPIEEEHALAASIAAGDDKALDKLVRHNLRFVVFLVRKLTAWQYGTIPPEDLLAMGNEYLVMAAKRWQPTNNARFSTFAKKFILLGVKREINNTANLIRLPVNITLEIKHLLYQERTLTQMLRRKPTNDEIAAVLECSPKRVADLYSIINHEPVSLDGLNQDKFTEEHQDES